MTTIKLDELMDALEWVSRGAPYESQAYSIDAVYFNTGTTTNRRKRVRLCSRGRKSKVAG